MKSEDITVIASTVIALTLVIGTVVYFQKEGEKKRLRQERIEQMQLNMRKEKERLLREQGDRKRYQKYREDITDFRGMAWGDTAKYKACMTQKDIQKVSIKN